MIVQFGNKKVDIVNGEEIQHDILVMVASMVEAEIVRTIKQLELIDTSEYFQGIKFTMPVGNEVEISSDVFYSWYLEYGTLDFGEQFNEETWPTTPIKKKDIPQSLRDQFPRGMNPFAPFRRVIFNKGKMEQYLRTATEMALGKQTLKALGLDRTL